MQSLAFGYLCELERVCQRNNLVRYKCGGKRARENGEKEYTMWTIQSIIENRFPSVRRWTIAVISDTLSISSICGYYAYACIYGWLPKQLLSNPFNVGIGKHAIQLAGKQSCTFACSLLNRILFCRFRIFSFLSPSHSSLTDFFCWNLLTEPFTRMYICVAHTHYLLIGIATAQKMFCIGIKIPSSNTIFHLAVTSTATAEFVFCFLALSIINFAYAHAVELMHAVYRAVATFHLCFGSFQHLDFQKEIYLIIDGMRTMLRDFHTHFFCYLLFCCVFSWSLGPSFYSSWNLLFTVLFWLMDMQSKYRELNARAHKWCKNLNN